uniref:Uncharacterized protein n=1 Tax=Arundo donax TaxID=35708 RepID=A0A0A9EQC9_ARUDO
MLGKHHLCSHKISLIRTLSTTKDTFWLEDEGKKKGNYLDATQYFSTLIL